VVAAAEAAPSLEAAADVLRPDIELPEAVCWMRRRVQRVYAALTALREGAGIYLVPIAFVLQPELLMIGDPGDAAVAALRLLAGVALITAVFTGHIMRTMPMAARVLAAPLAFANILPFRGGNEGMVPGVVEDGEFVLFSAGGDSLLWIAVVASGRPAGGRDPRTPGASAGRPRCDHDSACRGPQPRRAAP